MTLRGGGMEAVLALSQEDLNQASVKLCTEKKEGDLTRYSACEEGRQLKNPLQPVARPKCSAFGARRGPCGPLHGSAGPYADA